MIVNKLQETVDYIRNRTSMKPKAGIVLGSGLGAFVKEVQIECQIPYNDIPNFVPPSVEGHSGNLIFGTILGKPIAILQGRIHVYEGHDMDTVVFPIRTLSLLGIESLLLTNSAGGMGDTMSAGDFMIIEDHINMMGSNPLIGPNIKEFGPRFPDLSEAYDKKLGALMAEIFEKHSIRYHKGVYCGVTGPTYETPAEIRFMKMIGAQAVGMSTVPETIAANHMGLRVGAISCITNLAAGLSNKRLSHDEVTETAARVQKSFNLFLSELLRSL